MPRIIRESNENSLVYKTFLKESSERPTFICLPGANPIEVAMEASAYARKFSRTVNFVYNGNIQEVGPNDILFEKRPSVIKG